jgi:Ku protein
MKEAISRATYTGSIVICGGARVCVKGYSANSTGDAPDFCQVTPCCKARVQQKVCCKACGAEQNRSALKKGFEFGEEMVVLEKAEIEQFKQGRSDINIIGFCADLIPPVYYDDKQYYLVPDKKMNTAFAILREGMSKEGRLAYGTAVFSKRRQAVVLQAFGDAILARTLKFSNEVKAIPLVEGSAGAEQVEKMREFIRRNKREMDIEAFEDTYGADLRGLIERKMAGEALVVVEKKEASEADFEAQLSAMLEVK